MKRYMIAASLVLLFAGCSGLAQKQAEDRAVAAANSEEFAERRERIRKATDWPAAEIRNAERVYLRGSAGEWFHELDDYQRTLVAMFALADDYPDDYALALAASFTERELYALRADLTPEGAAKPVRDLFTRFKDADTKGAIRRLTGSVTSMGDDYAAKIPKKDLEPVRRARFLLYRKW